jgi:hypothetical protein
MTDQTPEQQTSGHTPHDPTQPLTFTAPTPPAFTPPPAPPAPQPEPEQDEDEDEDDGQASAPEPHADARGLGVTGKFPVPTEDDEVEQ